MARIARSPRLPRAARTFFLPFRRTPQSKPLASPRKGGIKAMFAQAGHSLKLATGATSKGGKNSLHDCILSWPDDQGSFPVEFTWIASFGAAFLKAAS
ncbi:hypothetical protein [Metarhizobium album]|uniref:hypothetical protein n=1 Tax=Metarhizobium album TaxID=2182425 RepID=UPI000FFEC71D|nr:hypothetical protein [Rhizobium album]